MKNVEAYYQDTLKWQDIAAGKRVDVGQRCGLCAFTSVYRHGTFCAGCPVRVVWPRVNSCAGLEVVEEAVEADGGLLVQMAAAKVVVLLEENEDALIKAMREMAGG